MNADPLRKLLMKNPPTPLHIDQEIFDLYDEYCHGSMPRREFFARASALTAGGLLMAQALIPEYVQAQTISFTDPRIKAQYVNYPSPGGTSGQMRGYLVQPTKPGPSPAVLVVHENRGLNPHIEDVARRLASEGFLALAPDGLSPVGGYPGNDDEGKDMQAKLDPLKLWTDMKNSALFLKSHALSTSKLGITGFCWGGGVTNSLSCELGEAVQAAAPYYGDAPKADRVERVKAPFLLHFAENDPRINAMWPAFETALKAHHVQYQSYTYAGTQHGFHNNSTPRYVEAAAKLSWERTLSFFKTHLS
jgi:carboxymethylenebutenolidase